MIKKSLRIAVAGAGIYGSTIALTLAAQGHRVCLYDPLGIMCAASVINQCRIHSGYHYPRSPETMAEILEVRDQFCQEYNEAIISNSTHYYAVPFKNSNMGTDEYEHILERFSLFYRPVVPPWINFDFIDRCYSVDEKLYDPIVLKKVVQSKIANTANIEFIKEAFTEKDKVQFNLIVYATYAAVPAHSDLFDQVELQVVEKILIQLPVELAHISLVIIDGAFTAFDPYAQSSQSMFGSHRHTNHWTTGNPQLPVPTKYQQILNSESFHKVSFSHFSQMVQDAKMAVPLVADAAYLGSRFTLRLVERSQDDRRILRIKQAGNEFIVFSGKVTAAVKAAQMISQRVLAYA